MIVDRSVIKDLARVFFWYPVRWFVFLIPFRSLYKVGNAIGRLDYMISNPLKIHRMAQNMAVLGCTETEANQIIQRHIKNHYSDLLELMKYPQLKRQDVDRFFYFDGLKKLDEQLTKGKGVLLVTAHFGMKQALQIALGLRGYDVHQIHYHMRADELSFIQQKISQRHRKMIESSLPVNFIPAKRFLRSAYNCLKNNGILIIAGDGIGLREHMERGYTKLSFLGKKMMFPANTFALAVRTDASVLFAFVVRNRFSHRIIIEAPPDKTPALNKELMECYVSNLERYVRRYPDHWEFWEEFDEETLVASS